MTVADQGETEIDEIEGTEMVVEVEEIDIRRVGEDKEADQEAIGIEEIEEDGDRQYF